MSNGTLLSPVSASMLFNGTRCFSLKAVTYSSYASLPFFRSMITQDSKSVAMIEKVVQRRKKWELIRRDYAIKYPSMNMQMPKDAASLSRYAICASSLSMSKKINASKERKINDTSPNSCIKGCKGKSEKVDNLTRKSRESTLDALVAEAGL